MNESLQSDRGLAPVEVDLDGLLELDVEQLVLLASVVVLAVVLAVAVAVVVVVVLRLGHVVLARTHLVVTVGAAAVWALVI